MPEHEHLRLHATGDVEEYAGAVTPFLEREPVQRNVLLTVMAQARGGGAGWTRTPLFWWVVSGGEVAGVASWTPPFPVLVSSLPPGAATPIAESVLERAAATDTRVAGVTGPRDSAWALARVLAGRTHAGVATRVRMIVHELRKVRDVPDPGGAMRIAAPADSDLVHHWMRAFNADIGEAHYPEGNVRSALERRRIWLWVHAGAPRSTATLIAPAGGVARIGGVYTPPRHRAHGYARRLVQQLSVAALAEPGVVACTLNTDAANPVSNSIYGQVGYVPVGEHVQLAVGHDE
ncbi:MAG: GNAT family N-acetyltransferase [Candidatus Dormibacteraeota bacterium]|nr:GNAT family N-acetyltransferase [Candidatus Dormibacteraeota bacterium]